MRTRKLTSGFGAAALAVTALGLASGEAMAADFWLRAGTTTVDLPDPASTTGGILPVVMWGYASCTDGSYASCGPVTVPGPALRVPAGDSQLTVTLRNTLPVATSLVVNGLYKAMTPVWSDGSTGPRTSATQRVRSFDAEAAELSGTATYTWSAKPGTYLYQSGTQPQVQVQMGLYGAVTGNAVDADAGATTPVRAQAYAGAPSAYDNQATLLYSEVDPVLHAAVADNSYGTTGPTSTFDYQPKYFLVNGAPYIHGSTAPIVPAPSGATGATLLRFLNAGLTTHVPSIQGLHWDLIAEDGKPYAFKRSQYTALLPAAKTMDVLLTPDVGGGRYAIVDRRLSLSNAGLPYGGMLAVLQYGAAGVAGAPLPGDSNQPPVAMADSYSGIAGVELSVGAAQGVLANDLNTDGLPQVMRAVAATGATTSGGSYVLNANGSFTYVPPTAGSTDSFDYTITDGKAISAAATVTISLAAPVAPALGAALDDFNRVPLGDPLGANWAQSTNVVLAAGGVGGSTGAAAAAIDLGGQAIWVADSDPSAAVDTSILGTSQYAGLTASALEKLGLILKATGGNTKDAPVNFVRVRMEGASIVVSTQVGGANTSVYVRQAAFPAGAVGGTLSAAVDAKGLVTVFLDGVFKGGVQLPDVGAWKGTGRIGMQLQAPGAVVDNFSGGGQP